MKKIVEWFEYIDWSDVLCAVWIAFLIAILIAFVVFVCIAIDSSIENANNAITSGVIVDKDMDSGGTYYHSDKNSGSFHSYPPSYYFTIRGNKNGETVDYTFEVTAEEYSLYKIGDKYER